MSKLLKGKLLRNLFYATIASILMATVTAIWALINGEMSFATFIALMALLFSVLFKAPEHFLQTRERESASAVAPSLFFRIRPANDYWSSPFGRQPGSWEPGVGIYIENIGLGAARNISFVCKAVGEIEEQRCEAEFGRLRVGEIYTLPSKHYPQLEVKESHKRIVIESIEYDDIRTPPNHYTIDESLILELNPSFFDEKDRGKTDPLGPKMA